MELLNGSALIPTSDSSWGPPARPIRFRSDGVRDRVHHDHRGDHDRPPALHVHHPRRHDRAHDRRGLDRRARRALHARHGDRVHPAPGLRWSSSTSSPVPLAAWAALCRRAGGNSDPPRRRRYAGCRAFPPHPAVRHRASRDGIARCEQGVLAVIRRCYRAAAVPRRPASERRPLLPPDPASGRLSPPEALRAVHLLFSLRSPK